MSKTNTRENLVTAAIEMIWQKNYNAISVDDICHQANAKKGSFYYYFESKAALVIAAMDEYFNTTVPVMEEIFSSKKLPIERFSGLCDIIIDKQKEGKEKYGHVCGCPFISIGSEMAGQEPLITQKIAKIIELKRALYVTTIKDLIKDGHIDKQTDATHLSNEIYNYILGQVTIAKITNNTEILENNLQKGLFSLIGISAQNTPNFQQSSHESA